MTGPAGRLADAVRRPLPLAYHPLYRFYEGGSMTRTFRGLPERPDDWWSEDWVGSCTRANNDGPDGHAQGLSPVGLPGGGTATLKELVEALPEEMVGARFAGRWGPITGVLVKLLSPAGQVPLHAHPTRAWARRHLGSPFGKTEAWILLDTPGDGAEPAYAGIGFADEIEVSDGRFSVAIVVSGAGSFEGDFGSTPARRGETFALPASLQFRVRAGSEPVRVIRCLGPGAE